MEFRVLGPLAIECGGHSVVISSPRQRALAALLLVHANRTVSTDRILDELWPGEEPQSGRDAVAFHIGRLRRALGACADATAAVRTRDGGYSLEIDPDAIDAGRFERLAAEGHARMVDDPAGAVERLSEALELWRGDPYEGQDDVSFLAAEARRLGELRLRVVEDRLEAKLALGRHAEIVVELQSLVDREPLHERPRGLLMTALYRAGRQADALRVYGDGRRILAEELGIDPSPELQALEASILRQDPSLTPAALAARPPEAGPRRNPFKGLRPFGEADAGDFFGREALTARLLERLAEVARAGRLLAVVGPSGSGKSSVVRAGLAPALRAGALDGSGAWRVGVMLPGSRPLDELAAALRSVAVAGGDVTTVPSARALGEDPGVFVDAVKALAPADGRLVLVVDQLEELWTLANPSECEAFTDTIAEGLRSSDGRLLVVATLRIDQLEAALRSPELGPVVREGTELVPPLDQNELLRAIERPAARAALALDPGLADTIVGEVADRPSMLPLLQYALTELAERADGGRITRADYGTLGGVLGALAGRAEATYHSLEPESRDAARQVFLHLVAVEATGQPAMRRVPLVTFEDNPHERSVVERFGRARLVAFGRDARTGEATVEVAHEALLARWPRLAAWVDAERDAMWTRRRLGDAALEWVEHGRDPAFLLTSGRLELLSTWASTTDLRLGTDERALLEASQAERARATDAEAARVAKERRLEQRGTRWLRALVAVFAIAALVSTGLLGFVWRQSEASAEQRAIASARELAVAANGRLKSDPSLALLLAVESARATADRGWITEQTLEALHWAVQAADVPYPTGDVPTTVRDAPDGPRGLYLLPVTELIQLARTAAGRSLSADECRTWLHVTSCPESTGGSSRPLTVMTADGTRSVDQLATTGLQGTSVRIWSQLPIDDLGSLLTEYAAGTGVGLVTTSGDVAADPLTAVGQADLAILARPGDVAALARQGRLLALADVLRPGEVAEIEAAPLADLGWIGDAGIGARATGARLAGVPLAVTASSLLWYPAAAFRAAGYRPPTTWAELDALVTRISAEGRTPWCMGLQGSEADGASGVDWFEDFVIARAGPEALETKTTWWPWITDPVIKDALLRVNAVLSKPGAVLGGVGSALRTPSEWTAVQMGTAAEPRCWLIHASADERARWIGPYRSDLTPIRMPIRDASTAMRARVYTLVILRDRPEVRAFVRHLLGEGFASQLAAADPAVGILPLGPTGAASWPASSSVSPAGQLAAALRAGDVWPDVSDRMSRALGLTALPQAVVAIAEADPRTASDYVDALLPNLWNVSAGPSP